MVDKGQQPIKTDQLENGDRIIIVLERHNDMDRGVIRFKGQLGKSHAGLWYGIELDEEKGRHDGKGFFKTEAKHATFCKLENLRKLVSEDFDMRAFKKVLRADALQAKKAYEAKKAEEEAKKLKEEPSTVSQSQVSEVEKGSQKTIDASIVNASIVTKVGGSQVDLTKKTEEKKTSETKEKSSIREKSPTKKRPVDPIESAKPTREKSPPKKPASPPKAQKKREPSPPKLAKTEKPSEEKKSVKFPEEPKAQESQPKESQPKESQPKESQPRVKESQPETRVADRSKSPIGGRKSVMARDDPAIAEKVKQVEKHYTDQLKEKEREIVKQKGTDRVKNLEKEKERQMEKIEELTIDSETLRVEKDSIQIELDEAQITIQEMQYDKEIFQLQMDCALDDEDTPDDTEELKRNYGILKMGMERLNEKYEQEKEEWQRGHSIISEQKRQREGVQIDDLKRDQNARNKEIDELKRRLDEMGDSGRYIESLTDQVLEKDTQISSQEYEIKELHDVRTLNEEMLTDQEEMNNFLMEDLEKKDDEVMVLEEGNIGLEEQKQEDNKIIARLRERQRHFQEEVFVL